MTPSRKKPGVAFWTTVVVVVALAAYPLSFGPACWITSHLDRGAQVVSLIYEPLIFQSPAFTRSGLHAYSQFGAAKGWHWRKVSGGWTDAPDPGLK